MVLTQQSALRSMHPLSNERGDKHKPAGGIAMPVERFSRGPLRKYHWQDTSPMACAAGRANKAIHMDHIQRGNIYRHKQ